MFMLDTQARILRHACPMPVSRIRYEDAPPPEWIGTAFGPETAAVAVKDPEVVKYANADEFYKGYKNKTELLGRKGIIVPKEGDAPEVFAKYREGMGIPEKPEGYKFKTPEKLHAELKVGDEFTKSFAARMHAKGVPQGQADALYQEFLGEISTSMTQRDVAQEKARLEGLTKLNQEWGKDTENNIAMARKAAVKVLGEDGFKQLGDFANNPQAVRLLHGLTKMLSEDAITSIGGVEAANANNADAEIKKVMGLSATERKEHPYWNENHPKHSEEVKRVSELYMKRGQRA